MILVMMMQNTSNTPWWFFWLLVIIALLSIVIWWAVTDQTRETVPVAPAVAEPEIKTMSEPEPVPLPPADDLTRIEGIGPKISSLLAEEADITTYAQLARAEAPRLVEILREAKLPMVDPRTWPEQAALAEAGKWKDLQILQNALKGGRRVT